MPDESPLRSASDLKRAVLCMRLLTPSDHQRAGAICDGIVAMKVALTHATGMAAAAARERDEARALAVVRGAGCQCSDAEACQFVRERNAAIARADAADEECRMAKERVARLVDATKEAARLREALTGRLKEWSELAVNRNSRAHYGWDEAQAECDVYARCAGELGAALAPAADAPKTEG